MTQLPIFVYGTLRPKQPNAHLWQDAAESVQTAVYPHGTLFSLGAYPMLIAQGTQPVQGNLLTLKLDLYDTVVRRLDALEGFDPDQPKASPYRREKRLVQLENGRFAPAWVYLGQRHIVQGKPIIPSGDWLQHASNHAAKTADFWRGLTTVTSLHPPKNNVSTSSGIYRRLPHSSASSE